MNSAPINNYPGQMGQIVLKAMEEILGYQAVNRVLDHDRFICDPKQSPAPAQNLGFSFEHTVRFQSALESVYGSRAGRGLSVRVGRACLKYSLCAYGSDLGLTDLAFRLLPLPTRIKIGSEVLASRFNACSDQVVRLEVDEKNILWHIEPSPLCLERKGESPCCALAVGFLQEALFWVSGGKYFNIAEKKWSGGDGRMCTLVVDRTPMS